MPVKIDQFVRSRRRTIAIQIRPDGTVIVRAPLRATEKQVREFVESKAGWIERKRSEARQHAALPARQFQMGERFLFLGEEYPLILVNGQRPALRFDGQFALSRGALSRARQVFEKWYKAQALRVLSERVGYLSTKHNFRPHPHQLGAYPLGFLQFNGHVELHLAPGDGTPGCDRLCGPARAGAP